MTERAESSTIPVEMIKDKSAKLVVSREDVRLGGGDWYINYSAVRQYSRDGTFVVTIDISAPPFGLAYDVVVEARGKQIAAGQLVQAKGTDVEWAILGKWPGGDIPDRGVRLF